MSAAGLCLGTAMLIVAQGTGAQWEDGAAFAKAGPLPEDVQVGRRPYHSGCLGGKQLRESGLAPRAVASQGPDQACFEWTPSPGLLSDCPR